MAREQRRLAAIVAVDVVGYSRLMGRDESGTLARLREHRALRLEPALARHGGRLVKLTGDGALIEFASAVDALAAAIEFQQTMAEANRDQPEGSLIVFRIGLHVGDLIVDGDDLYGDGVNVAARLEGQAPTGGIVISRNAHDAVAGRLSATFDDLGSLALKNIERPIQAFSVRWNPADWQVAETPAERPSGGVSSSSTDPPLMLPDKPSIAVLPFQNMSGDPEQEYFTDGMVEEVITGLSRIKWLAVISRNSSFIYKNKAVAAAEAAKKFGVRYVLEGSIRKSGNRVRVTAQLIDAETGVHLWAEKYDRLLSDVFALQDEIAMCVIGAIEPNLRKAEVERVKRQRPSNPNAYDLVLRALPHVYSSMPRDAEIAISLLSDAIKLEPDYAAAQAFSGLCFHVRFIRGDRRPEDRAAAIQHARAAVARGNDDATSIAVAAFVIAMNEHDAATALPLFDRALELSNSNVFALACSAQALAFMRQPERAIERAELAIRLSPFDALNYRAYLALAVAHFYEERYNEAAEAARSVIAINPSFSFGYALLAAALMRLGEVDAAHVNARAVLEHQPSFTIRGFAAVAEFDPTVFKPLADAWREVGLPQ